MTAPEVVIIRTGTANIASILAAFRRIGAAPRLAHDADDVAQADLVVLPGVGSFGASIEPLRADGTDEAILARIDADRSLLAVCVGLQLLAESSEESPGVQGLGVIPQRITAFTGVRTPQFGWNRITAQPGTHLLRTGDAYFANSYRLTDIPAGWSAATSDHGGPFIAGLERGAVLACQFHPELSGRWGLDLLSRWVERKALLAC